MFHDCHLPGVLQPYAFYQNRLYAAERPEQYDCICKMQSGQRVEETKRVALQIDSMIRADIPEITIINLSYGSEEGFLRFYDEQYR